MEELKRNFPLRFKKNERDGVLEWCNMQGNFNDAIRFLIEKEVYENGIRNLETIIPAYRDDSYFKEFLSSQVSKFATEHIDNSRPETKEPYSIKEIKTDHINSDDIGPGNNESDNDKSIIKGSGEVPDCYF